LEGISIIEATDDEDLDLTFWWRELRKLTSNLTLHYERKLYFLLPDAPENPRYAGKYLEVYRFPDGRIQIRAAGVSLPYSTYRFMDRQNRNEGRF
jgi:hypothetical protein